MTLNELKCLPRQLISLKCIVESIEGGAITLDLPKKLEKLIIGLNVEADGEYMVDISYLTKAKDLSLSDNCLDNPLFHSWILPKNVEILTTNCRNIVSPDFATNCPHLVEWHLDPNRFSEYCSPDEREDGGDRFRDGQPKYSQEYISSLVFPPTIKRLKVPIKLFTLCDGLEAPELEVRALTMPGIKIPDTLTEFHIEYWSAGWILLNFDLNTLNLNILSIEDGLMVRFVGELPSTLTKLSFFADERFNFDKLQYLERLTDLHIQTIDLESVFLYNRPYSLKKLDLLHCSLKQFHIRAPQLETLLLSGNIFEVLDSNHLIIPETVNELYLKDCNITRLEFVFPPRLQVLDLINNKPTRLNNLPQSLRRLDCQKNHIGRNNKVSVFPTELEYLNIRKNWNDWNLFKTLNLSKCTKLKKLLPNKFQFNNINRTTINM